MVGHLNNCQQSCLCELLNAVIIFWCFTISISLIINYGKVTKIPTHARNACAHQTVQPVKVGWKHFVEHVTLSPLCKVYVRDWLQLCTCQLHAVWFAAQISTPVLCLPTVWMSVSLPSDLSCFVCAWGIHSVSLLIKTQCPLSCFWLPIVSSSKHQASSCTCALSLPDLLVGSIVYLMS